MARKNIVKENSTAKAFNALFLAILILGGVVGGLILLLGLRTLDYGGFSSMITGIIVFVSCSFFALFMKAISEIIQLLEDIKNKSTK